MFQENISTTAASIVALGPGRLDSSRAKSLRELLKAVVQAEEGHLILDLQDVYLLDSTILGVLVATFRDLPEGRSLVLCNVGPHVQSILHLTHLDRVLANYSSREEALSALP